MIVLRFISGILDRLCIVLGAFVGSQLPAFMYQYTQRLGGHVSELDHLLGDLRKLADLKGRSLEGYIQKFLANSDPDFVMQGEFMQLMFYRWQNLSKALNDLNASSIWTRPYVFFREMNYDIASSTYHAFKPSISLTVEGLCYTGIGMVMGYLFYQSLKRLFWFVWGGFTRIKQA